MDGEVTGALKRSQTRGIDSETPEDQRGIQRDRRERIAGYAIRLSVSSHRRDDRYARSVCAERGAKITRIDRRIVAREFIGWIGNGRLLRRIIHRPAS